MTRAEYLETLADCRMVIDLYELAPMTFAACPGKVSRALQRWATATDEERAEAGALNETQDQPAIEIGCDISGPGAA